jgi:hypothetical protein
MDTKILVSKEQQKNLLKLFDNYVSLKLLLRGSDHGFGT